MAIPLQDIGARSHASRARGLLRGLGRFAKAKPLGAFGLAVILVMVVTAIFADVIAPHDPLRQHIPLRLSRPGVISPEGKPYILGGDESGRDLFSRVVYGARTSLFVSLGAVAIGSLIGSALGLLSGYYEGKLDLLLQRVMDSQMAIPSLILAMLLVTVMPRSPTTVVLAIGIAQIPQVNRVIRGATLSNKRNAYVEAAKALGASNLRVMAFHILPNVVAPVIILATSSLGGAILVEASLSFLGLGTPPPTPSWGRMISDAGRRFILRDPKLLAVPGVVLSLAVLAVNLLGDAVRDVLDPRLRGTRH